MATTLLVVASLLLGLGPTAVGLMALLLRYPQLLLVALTSAGTYYLIPIVATSVWYALLGGERYGNAEGVFVVWMATVVEVARLYVCKWVLRAEAEFQLRDQTIVACKQPLLAKMPLGAAVGLGVSAVHVAITLGVASNAEVALTWVDHGGPTGAWMPSSVDNMVWFDVAGCPQLPKMANVALQALFFSGLHVVWSVWMMYGVDAAFAVPKTKAGVGAAALNVEERTPLANAGNRADEEELATSPALHRVPPTAERSGTGDAGRNNEAVDDVNGHDAALPRRHGLLLIAATFVAHTCLRLVSLAGSDAMVWEPASMSWRTHTGTRGCSVVLPVQATLLLGCVVASMVLWRQVSV